MNNFGPLEGTFSEEAPTYLGASLMTAEELAQMLGVSLRTIWRMRSARQLPPPINVRACTRWKRSDIARWLDLQGRPANHSTRATAKAKA